MPEANESLKLTLPNIPRPPDEAALRAAINRTCELFGDVAVGRCIDAVKSVEVITANGYSVRHAVWAVWMLVEQGALIAHPRPNIDVMRESGIDTFEDVDDERPRFVDGTLIPTGPYPVKVGERAPWQVVCLEPNHALLDNTFIETSRPKMPQASTDSQEQATNVRSTNEIEMLDWATPPLDTASADWVLSKDVKKLDFADADSLRVLRSVGQKNAQGTFGVDRSGRRWRKPAARSNRVFYWKPSLLTQTPR